MSKMRELLRLHVLSPPTKRLFAFVNTGPVSPTPPSMGVFLQEEVMYEK